MTHETSHSLAIKHKNGVVIKGKLVYFRSKDTENSWSLSFISSVTKELKFTNVDLFECLIDLRQTLSEYNYIALCNGARLDVYPSGMCRDMGDGAVAYIIKLGESVNLDNLVGIFDYAEPKSIASVDEQRNFYEAWIYPNGKDDPVNKKIKIQHFDGSIIEGELIQYRNSNPRKIKFTSSVTPPIDCINTNFFECLIDLRTNLSKFNYQPLCNGARLDTYISSVMIRMFRGNDCHVFVNGKVPNQDDEINIFDYAEPELIASVETQKKYYESWLDSIKSIPFSTYGDYGIYKFPELYFRLVKIGALPLMWLFDIENESHKKRSRALSPISPEQVEQMGSLKGEAIIGFIHGKVLSIDNFIPNKVFKDFMQKVIAAEASKDSELQAAALEQQAGWLYIIDNRVADLEREETNPEDILGVFEIKDGRIVANSYQPNENYLLFGNNGLMQLPASLHESLIKALESLSD